jgi:hypothetical protein
MPSSAASLPSGTRPDIEATSRALRYQPLVVVAAALAVGICVDRYCQLAPTLAESPSPKFLPQLFCGGSPPHVAASHGGSSGKGERLLLPLGCSSSRSPRLARPGMICVGLHFRNPISAASHRSTPVPLASPQLWFAAPNTFPHRNQRRSAPSPATSAAASRSKRAASATAKRGSPPTAAASCSSTASSWVSTPATRSKSSASSSDHRRR